MHVNFKAMISALCAFLLLGTFACQDENEVGTARVVVRLTDSPADYEEVNIDVQEVMVNPDNDDEGWVALEGTTTGVFDLLELTGGIDTILADAELPAGRLNQIRLVLGEENTVMVDGQLEDLDTPSAQQSGLKVQVNQDLEDGETYTILLDFDAAQSVVEAGNSGKFLLKPVIRATVENNGNSSTGSIKGTLQPADVQSLVYAIRGTDSLSTYSNDEGAFLLQSVPAGTWSVTIVPDTESGLAEETIDNIDVVAGEAQDIGSVNLQD